MERASGETCGAGMSAAETAFEGLPAILARRAGGPAENWRLTFIDGDGDGPIIDAPEFAARVGGVARTLRTITAPGETVLLLYPPGIEFLVGFMACLASGRVAVPVNPPRRNRLIERVDGIVADTGARIALTTSAMLADQAWWRTEDGALAQLDWRETDRIAPAGFDAGAVGPEDVAFIQYTSGSTSAPRGVVVTHGNLIAVLARMGAAWGIGPDSVMVSWLPAFHDLGLIFGLLQPLFSGCATVAMAPARFLQTPARWLEAITRYRGTHTAAPSFAYEACVRRITDAERAGLDLSSLRMAMNAAEPIDPSVMAAFAERFAPNGFAANVSCPAYGLAESTLAITANPVDVPAVILAVDSCALETADRAVPQAGGRALVGSGRALPDIALRIVDPVARRALEDGAVGEIWARGPMIAKGYWRNQQASAEVFGAQLAGDDASWLRTGDLGFLRDGELFVTGRLKDVIIIRGANHYPQDIERLACRSHPALRPECTAAFALPARPGAPEGLAIVQEIERVHRRAPPGPVFAAIRDAVWSGADLVPDAIVLIEPGSVPRTSSGKIRRRATRAAFLDGSLRVIATWQRPGVAGRPSRPAEGGLRGWMLAWLAERCGAPEGRIDPDESFAAAGLDSLGAAELAAAIGALAGRAVSPAAVFDYPTPNRLLRHLESGPADPVPPAHPDHAERVIADLRQRLAEVEVADAIAVIGMACRFPGAASDIDGYWRMATAGENAIGPVPATRARDMRAEAGQSAALLDDIETFDAAFFDIAPREAVQMDPQQRLFLEVAWHALEDAGQTRAGLAGSLTGAFVGVHNHSSGYLELQTADVSRLNEYSATGSGHDIIAGRLAYLLDLRGPSAAINTACSSSLVAVHMACQSLRARDCGIALAGGVNLILGPMQSRLFGLGAMLAPDGRCKTFDARANGYGRGEGCGVVVLKRLADAVADRDRVIAVIRGSAVNQDGRTNGLTAPNGLSQQALIRHALQRSGLAAARIGFVEAHGTGTALGDPIEVEALATIYGAPEPGAAPCFLGSAKSNINHLEGAAGIAGLIRAILAVREGTIPPVAGFERLNPHLSLAGTRLAIPDAAVEWRSDAPRVAAVSAFGWSGVNAHVLVEQAPATPPGPPVRPTMMLVSAADAPALSVRAAQLVDALERVADDALESFAWTATSRRSHYKLRIAVAGAGRAELARALRQAAEAAPAASPETGPRVGFLIGGDAASGALGAELMAEDDVFRGAVDACTVGFADAPGGDFASLPAPARSFAFAAGIAAMLTRWGIRPAAIAGWGAGAPAAAYLAGEASLAEATARVSRTGSEAGGSADAAAVLARAGVTHAIRLDTLSLEGATPAASGSARLRLMHILAGLAACGVDLAWDAIYAPSARLVSLPAHQFNRRRHWIAEPPPAEAAPVPSAAPVPADWFFETRWRPEPPTAAVGDRPARLTWLILGEPDGPGDQLASLVRSGDGHAMRLSNVDAVQLRDVTGYGAWAVVDLRALDRRAGPAGAEAMRLARQAAALGRGLDLLPAEAAVKLWVVTTGAHAIGAGAAPDLASAPLWGLCRSLILDHPKLWGGLVDLDPASAFDAAPLYREILASAAEADEIAFRAGVRQVNRLVSTAPPQADTLRVDPAATYLVTGAFGGIGPELAVWLARRGATSLVLAGRTLGKGDDDGAHPSFPLRQRLRSMGVDARLTQCDVGDRASVAALFETIRQSGAPLRGVFHAAGAAYEPVASVADGDLAVAFRAKVDGGLLLDEHSRGFDLDMFVLFSSAAGVLGARGRGHYAAANAFLDALAAARCAEGLPALSIAWGLWGTDGEGTAHLPYFQRVGLNPMAPATALDAMAGLLSEQAAGRGDLHPLVAALDGGRLRSALELQGRGRFLSALAADAPALASEASQELVQRVRQTPAALRRGLLIGIIAAEVRAVMELAPEDPVGVERGFFDLGMGSLMTVALKARLEEIFGVSLPSTLAMDYPSVAALAGYFETRLTGDFSVPPVPPVPAAPAAAATAVPDAGLARALEDLADDEVGEALAAELRALVLLS
jgi:acyl transferase domain-containing protein/acyl-CoA synthetase (AMP-forming)/AMP-acid ligase II/acyl carrier protein